MFSIGLSTTVEAIVGIFGLALIVRLESTGWLQVIANDYNTGNFAGLFSPPFLVLVFEYFAPAVIISLLVWVLACGFVYSAEYGSYWQAQGGLHVGVADVMSRFVERWKPMAWTIFLSNLTTGLPITSALGLTAVLAYFTPPSLGMFLVVATILLIGVFLTIAFALFFIYTPVAVAAEGLSGLAAMRKSWRQVRGHVGTAFGYALIYVVLTGALLSVTTIIPFANLLLSSLASIGITILVTPVLHLTKTEIYAETLRAEPVEFKVYPPILSDLVGPLLKRLWEIFIKGLRELKAFALDSKNLGYHFVSAAGLVFGWVLGVWIGGNGLSQFVYALGYVPGRINPAVTGAVPLTTGVYIFFHNWEASLATALSGVWFPGIPFVTLMLNGAMIGALSDVVPNVTMLAAAVLPHGIIELPSFVLSGSAGIKLGVVYMKSFRNPDAEKVNSFHAVARQTVYLVIGLALLFFVAGAIEGNVTPVIMRMAGWN
jgi:uncharacterized membrane protein SpoIIM required for sporulation